MKEPSAQQTLSILRFMKMLPLALRSIHPRYIQLPVDGADAPIYRERVFCYELYHQLRRRWRLMEPYILNGEVDKKAHPRINRGLVPDFLVHTPSRMAGNLIVLEVKPATADPKGEGVKKDLESLEYFITEVGYLSGILLFYGSRFNLEQRGLTRLQVNPAISHKMSILCWDHVQKEFIPPVVRQ